MNTSLPFYHSLIFKVNLVAFAVFLLIVGLMLREAHMDRQEMISLQEDTINQIAVETIDRRFRVSYEILETGISQVLSNPAITEAFAQRDREALSWLVMPSFHRLESVGICRFHFHLPDQTTFFRAHDPEHYGDDLSGFREIVVSINEDPQHTPIKGLEQGVSGLYLRYVAPVYHEEAYVGSVELGMCVGSRILQIFKNVSGGEWYLYTFDQEAAHLVHSTHPTDLFSREMNAELAEKLQAGEVLTEVHKPYVVQTIPVEDFKGQYSYYLKRVFDNSKLIALQQQYNRNSLLVGFGLAATGSLLLWVVLQFMLRPLIYLEQKVRRFESGTLQDSIEMVSRDEIGYLAGAMEKMRQSILKREEALTLLSLHDQLTGAYNRHYFEQMLQRLDEEKAYPITTLMADVDDLKVINDELGHTAGDAHLILSARVLKKALRQSDHLFRIGGDEFAALLPETDQGAGDRVLKRMEEEIKLHNQRVGGESPHLSISLGAATCEGSCGSLKQVLTLADQRMYERKQQKKGGKKQSI